MKRTIPFLAPRLVGARFEGHAIPLEMLKDLAVLEEMIVEVAKWRYLKEHPDRKRLPKRFTDGIAIKLTEIRDGSAIPQLSLSIDTDLLFPAENQKYFELARDSLVGAIDAAEQDGTITEHLPEYLLGYFDRIGRGLRDDESIEFAPQAPERKARLTKGTRRKLLFSSSQVQDLTEEVTLRGAIPEADQAKMTFELQVINGPKVVAPIAAQHLQTVMDAFNGYQQGARVLLQGIGQFNRNDRLQSLETVEHLSLLDANDVAARLEELRNLRSGWLNGKGFAPSSAGLDWLAQCFMTHYPEELPLPYLYPTAEGGIQAEWSVAATEITLEIDIDHHSGEWHELNLTSNEETTRVLALNELADWQWVIDRINNLSGGAA